LLTGDWDCSGIEVPLLWGTQDGRVAGNSRIAGHTGGRREH
jgi:hypothetical protein